MAIGKSVKRIDAYGKVTGETKYSGDIYLPETTQAKILFAGVPHARVKSIDTSKAEQVDGVLMVVTAVDVPVNEYGLGIQDQPVFCGPGGPKPFTDRVRFVGDQIAMVIAETAEIAEQARDLIEVDYEILPVVTDPLEARKEDSVLVHPDHGSNVLTHYRVRFGDVEDPFAGADVIVEEEYFTPAQEHIYLQPEAGVAYFDEEGRLTVECAGQWVHEEQEMIAHAMGLEEEQVRVIHPAIGGAFGGREDISIQIALAVGASRLREEGINRPVRLVWTREESIIGHHKRHPYIIKAKWGASKDGKLVAAQAEVIADAGAYAYTSPKVQGNATLMVTGPYDIPNVLVDSYSVYTNNIPGGAFRGFGGPQGAFAAEMQMNRLAEALDMDLVEFRMRNLADDDTTMSVNSKLPKGVTIQEVAERCALDAGWQKRENGWAQTAEGTEGFPAYVQEAASSVKRGVGLAVSYKNIGFSFGYRDNNVAKIELHGEKEIERVVLHQAGADVGQGAHTVFRQMAAFAVGVPEEKVELVLADTAHTKNSGSTSASRLTFFSGNAIKGAAEAALEKWQEEDRPAIAEYKWVCPPTSPFDPETGESQPNYAYGYTAEAVALEVDTDTGMVRIADLICVDDVGKAINPDQIVGQIEGCIVQAAGYVIGENFIQEEGYVKTDTMSTYLIPTVLDIPDKVRSVILEYGDDVGPWGAKGMSEMPFLPLAPAIMMAFHQATGVWVNEFPLTPDRVLLALGKI